MKRGTEETWFSNLLTLVNAPEYFVSLSLYNPPPALSSISSFINCELFRLFIYLFFDGFCVILHKRKWKKRETNGKKGEEIKKWGRVV